MPIVNAAPQTVRDISQRLLLALLVASATLPAQPASAAAATPTPVNAPTMAASPTAAPMYVPGPTGVMGYYMMQGSTIVSGAFPSAPACFKALATLMKSLPANTAPIVCAHRVP